MNISQTPVLCSPALVLEVMFELLVISFLPRRTGFSIRIFHMKCEVEKANRQFFFSNQQ